MISSTLAALAAPLLNCVRAFVDVLDDAAAPPLGNSPPHDLKQIGLLIDRQPLDCFQDFIKCHRGHSVHLSPSDVPIYPACRVICNRS